MLLPRFTAPVSKHAQIPFSVFFVTKLNAHNLLPNSSTNNQAALHPQDRPSNPVASLPIAVAVK
jgi:hypothetical protein